MPSPNPTVRRQHSGNAVPTTLSAPIVSGADTSFTIAAATGWPDGSVGNFEVTINAGQSDVEKILCSTRTGTTVNVATRGHDSTTAASHASGATVTHTISALEIDEMNQHTNATAAVHGVTGSVVGTSDAQTLTNKTLTAPAIASPAYSGTATGSLAGLTATGAALDAASTVGGVSGTSLAADRTAWTTYTPTLQSGWTLVAAAYKQVGKSLRVRIKASFSGTSNPHYATWATLPLSLTAAADQILPATYPGTGGALNPVTVTAISASNTLNLDLGAGYTSPTVVATGTIEVA